MSETAKWRHKFISYCVAGKNGLDIGFGGDPIIPSAITLDRKLDHICHSHVGCAPQNLTGDASSLSMFKDNSLDYVYSSHCIEDFEQTENVLTEWIRVLKHGGYLCLLFPDELRYRTITDVVNVEHKHENMGLKFIVNLMCMGDMEIIEEAELFKLPDGSPDYNCLIIAKKA